MYSTEAGGRGKLVAESSELALCSINTVKEATAVLFISIAVLFTSRPYGMSM
jgi:hypothetical protein